MLHSLSEHDVSECVHACSACMLQPDCESEMYVTWHDKHIAMHGMEILGDLLSVMQSEFATVCET